MERTARLVRLALAGLPDPRVRGAADVAAAVARSGGGSGHELAHAAGGSRELAHAVVRKEKRGGRASQVGGEDYSKGGQGEREAKQYRPVDDAKGGQAEAVGSKAKDVADAASPSRPLFSRKAPTLIPLPHLPQAHLLLPQ
ncbi:unnamed protein product [Miscanthus lutarioriparius]|uniref:Uncharacterized protein n=1 Tax=Miscanthus lutarioriparius TaxID=422564 RepID=A0A811QCD6_9POAL|nr:unnamed protein product [Miscanthus lutarioriparius]